MGSSLIIVHQCTNITYAPSVTLNQETANVMYSLALLSFDAHEQSELILNGCDPDGRSANVEQGGGERVESIWRIHEAMLRAYLQKDPQTYTRENYDQLAVYFELMRVLKRGQDLVKQVCGRMPRMSGALGGDRCPIDGTKVYSKEYFTYDNAVVVVDYLYRVANASTSSPYNWVGATPAVQSRPVQPGERTSVPDTELLGMLAPLEYQHAEYAAAVTLAFALLGAFLYLCRCILFVMVHRSHLGRRGYTELP
jgi:hypothetical protein